MLISHIYPPQSHQYFLCTRADARSFEWIAFYIGFACASPPPLNLLLNFHEVYIVKFPSLSPPKVVCMRGIGSISTRHACVNILKSLDAYEGPLLHLATLGCLSPYHHTVFVNMYGFGKSKPHSERLVYLPNTPRIMETLVVQREWRWDGMGGMGGGTVAVEGSNIYISVQHFFRIDCT